VRRDSKAIVFRNFHPAKGKKGRLLEPPFLSAVHVSKDDLLLWRLLLAIGGLDRGSDAGEHLLRGVSVGACGLQF